MVSTQACVLMHCIMWQSVDIVNPEHVVYGPLRVDSVRGLYIPPTGGGVKLKRALVEDLLLVMKKRLGDVDFASLELAHREAFQPLLRDK